MKNITKKNHTYYSDFTNSQGKRVRRSLGKDKTQAKIKLIELMNNIKVQSEVVGQSTKQTLTSYKSAVNEFIDSNYGIKNAWIKKRWDQRSERQGQMVFITLKRFQEFAQIGKVENATLPQMKRFLVERSKFVKPATINKNIQFLQRFFSWCEDMNFVNKSEARGLKKLKCKAPVRYSFQALEINKILDNAGYFKDFYVVALATGLRPCDMWNLSTDDFTVDGDYMFFNIVSEKTDELIEVPINDEARDIVERSSGKLFPNAHEEIWRKALRRNLKSNFDPSYVRKHNIRLHTLRHTFAVTMLNLEVPKEVIQNLLGHASIKTTEIYAPRMDKKVLAKHTSVFKIVS